MGVASCLFVVRAPGVDRALIAGRAAALCGFYFPLGARSASIRWFPGLDVAVGEIELEALDGGRGRNLDLGPDAWGWGGPFPPGLERGTAAELRATPWLGAMVAGSGERVRIVTAAEGPTALYVCEEGPVSVWATHAVAASVLCLGRAALDASVLPELVLTEFVGGARTHLHGVSAVPAASQIELGPGAYAASTWWPERDRWAAVPEDEAQDFAEAALLESLGKRTEGVPGLVCGLTAGLDSRVVAVALRELGREFGALTWGLEGWPDVTGAAELAGRLGAEHRRYGFDWNDDDETRAAIETVVRWSEGLEPTHGFGWPEVPQSPGGIVTGRGGETGRAFFYARGVDHEVAPDREQAIDAFLANRPARLEGASPEAKANARQAIGGFVDAAYALGHEGWRALDVVYGRERLGRWDRTRLMRQSSLYLPAFTSVGMQRALLSLPLDARLKSGFHHAFLESRGFDLEAKPPPPALGLAARVAARLRRRRGGTWVFSERWSERPRTREWVRDELLARPVVAEVFGEEWAAELRRGFQAGEQRWMPTALMLLAPLALAGALEELNAAAGRAG